MGEQTLGAATSVRTAELCRNAHLSTGTPPPSSSSPAPTTTFPTRWNTSVSFPQPSSPSPLLSSPCPTRKWPSQAGWEVQHLPQQHLHQHLHQPELLLLHLHLRLHLHLTPDSLASTRLPPSVPNSSKSLEALAPSFLQSMPIPTKASRTPGLDLVLEQWVPLQLATVSLDRTVTSHSGQALVHLSTPTDNFHRRSPA